MENNSSIEDQDTLQTDIKKAGLLLKLSVVLLTIVAIVASFFAQYLKSSHLSTSIGGAIAPLIIGGIIVLLFQIFKGFRNNRSRLIIFLVMQVLFTLSSLSAINRFIF